MNNCFVLSVFTLAAKHRRKGMVIILCVYSQNYTFLCPDSEGPVHGDYMYMHNFVVHD